MKSAKKFFERLLLSFALLLTRGKFALVTSRQVSLVLYEGVLDSKALNSSFIFQTLDDVEKLWNKGMYQEAVSLRSRVFEYCYENTGCMTEDYSPPFYSPQYTSNIGHLAVLMLHQELINQDKIPAQTRFALIEPNSFGSIFIDALDESYSKPLPIYTKSNGSIVDMPSTFHLFERIEAIKMNQTFQDIYRLFNEVFESRSITQIDSLINFSSKFQEQMQEQLEDYGIKSGDRFVTLQIRKQANKRDIRGASPESFDTAIRLLLSQGIKVITLGGVLPKTGLSDDRIISLDELKTFNLQIYCLSKAFFHIGTQSGPTMLGHCLGTPVLQTNTTAIGRNVLHGSQHSMYLPKRFFSTGGELSLSQILSSPIAYAESMGVKLHKLQVQENTDEEIALAVRDMLRVLENEDYKFVIDANVQLREAQKIMRTAGKGQMAPSFLENNERWYK